MTDHPTAKVKNSRGSGLPRIAPLGSIACLFVAASLAAGPAQAAISWDQCRTEGGTATITNNNDRERVTLGTTITDTTKAFLLLDVAGTSTVDQGQDHMVSGFISATDELTFDRRGTTEDVLVSYTVVECFNNEFSVQRGEIQLASGDTSGTNGISAVDTARSIVLVSSRTDDGSNSEDTGLVTGELSASDTVRVERSNASGVDTWVRYEVVTFSAESNVTVQTGVVDQSFSSLNVSISAVTLNRAWLYHNWNASSDGLQQTAVAGQITATNQLTFRHHNNAYTNRVVWYVVEFPATTVTVQRGSEASDSTNGGDNLTNVDISISAVSSVNRAFPFVTNTTQGTGTAYPRNRWTDYLLDTSTIRTTNGRTDGSNSVNFKEWQVVEFPATPAVDSLSATNNTAIASANPTEGDTGVLMQRFQVDSDNGGDGSVWLSTLTLQDDGNASSLTAYVYIDTVSQSTLPGTATLLGQTSGWNGSSTAISLSGAARQVQTGTSKYVYIVYDVPSGQAGNTIQSNVSSIAVDTPDNGDNTLTPTSTSNLLTVQACSDPTPSTITIPASQTISGNPYDASLLFNTTGNVTSIQCKVTTGSGGGAPFEELTYFDNSDVNDDWVNWTPTDSNGVDESGNEGTNGYLWTHESGVTGGGGNCNSGTTYTTSNNTGPCLLDTGTGFAYMEASSGTNGDRYLTRDVTFDADTYELNVSFDSHLYTTTGAWLRLQASPDGSNWTTEWETQGPQSSIDAWVSTSIDLFNGGGLSSTQYNSGTVHLRFWFVYNGNYTSDVSLDTIRVFGPARSVETTCTDWAACGSVPASTANGSLCGDYVTTTDAYNLYVRGTDPDCGDAVTGAPDPQQFTWSANNPPAVTITSPADSSSFNEGVSVSFVGTATDVEDGNLTAGLTWSSSLDGAIGTGGSFSRNDLSVGVHTITASVTDSGSATGQDQITITINNVAPTVTITSPPDASTFTQGASISFAGTASDPVDGDISANLSWSSSLDGAIGSGASFSRNDLSIGIHTITASVADPDGGSPGQDQITITIDLTDVTTTGTPSAAADSCSQITVTAPFTGDANATSSTDFEYSLNAGGPWTGSCSNVTGASPRTCPVPGLVNATPYYFRVTFIDTADGVNGTNPQVVGPTSTQDCRVAPGTPSAAVDACDQITVSAPFTGDANANSTTTFRRGPSGTGPWTAACGGVTGASPRVCVDTGVAESNSYWYQVEFFDADQVNGANPQVIGSFTTPACAVNDTTTGTASAAVSGCSQITVTAPFTGDSNLNGSVKVEYNTSNNWPGTTACGTVGGASPRTCLATGLNASTSYWTRVTYSDPDGVTGNNPQVVGPDTTASCSGNGSGPMILFLAPSNNATIGGTDRVKVQIFDPDGLDPTTPVEWSINGGAFSATGVNQNANYDCNMGSQTDCAVHEFDVDTSGLANGSHYVTVRATDNAATATSAQLSLAFRVNNNASSAAAGGGFLLRRTHSSQLCTDCHNLPAHTSQATSFRYGNWGQECSSCHTPHQTRNIFLIEETIETPNSGQKSVDFRNRTGVAEFSYATPQGSGNGVNLCEVCHTKTKNSDSTARARNDSPTDWAKHYTSQCTGCHAHSLGFSAGESDGSATCAGCHPDIWQGMNGATAKTSRHGIGNVEGTNDAVTDSGLTWGSPLSGNAAAVRSCLNMCHDDHPHTTDQDTTHEYNVYRDATNSGSRAASSTSTRTNRAKTDFDNAATNGGMCVSCHRNPINSAWPTIPKADYNASAHNFTTDAGGAWSYTQHDGGVFDRNCTKCHSDSDVDGNATTIPFGAVHYADNPRLLSNALNPSGTAANNVCYNCHGNGTTGTDRSGKNLVAFTSKTYNHPVDSDTVHDGAAEYSVTYNDGTFKGANRHVNCDDCHNPHKAGTTLHTPGTTGNVVGSTSPLFGATGASFTSPGTNWSATSTGNYSWTTSVTKEYEVCFKCHSNFAFNGSPPTSQTDVAQEFSTSNASYHPVVGALPASDPGTNGSSRLTSTQLTNGWAPGDTMYCADCHGPETASPAVQGPHGSAIQYILWPSRNASYTEWPGIGTLDSSWGTTFCRNCHPLDEDGNWSNNKAHDKHKSRNAINGCYSCHILVPHGGKMSRLIGDRDGTMPARYAYQGVISNMEITSFTKQTDPSQYAKQNCRAACEDPGDHDVDANENW